MRLDKDLPVLNPKIHITLVIVKLLGRTPLITWEFLTT
jgi:hypothetical protein